MWSILPHPRTYHCRRFGGVYNATGPNGGAAGLPGGGRATGGDRGRGTENPGKRKSIAVTEDDVTTAICFFEGSPVDTQFPRDCGLQCGQ